MSKEKRDFDNNIGGLTSHQVKKILETDGYNELPSAKKKSLFDIFIAVIKEPMLLLLVFSGTIYFFIGELSDALMLIFFVFVVIGITFYQERKTEKALEALKNLSSPRTLVIRDGVQLRIPGREVVKGDIIVLREGDRVPADAYVLDYVNLLIDESILTGESVPVRKSVWDKKMDVCRPGGDDLPFVFSGTLVNQGRGIAKVYSTGVNTQMGKIGVSLKQIKKEDTLLNKEIGKLVRTFAGIGISLAIIVVIIYAFLSGDLTSGLLAGISLSMALLPEEFPVVLTVFLTLGAWRISRRKVLARHNAAIETLGAATVLCVDKTGTLTKNQQTLHSLNIEGNYFEFKDKKSKIFPEKYHLLLEYAYLASVTDPFDPLEKEIKSITQKYLSNSDHVHPNWNLIREYPLSKELLALSHVYKAPKKDQYIIAAKGSPEAIADLCHMSKKQIKELKNNIEFMSDKGLRIIGVAQAEFSKKNLPPDQHQYNFKFIGLLGFIDPVRDSVAASVSLCYKAGIRTIMMTGDYPGTAVFVAKKIGLKNPSDVITGDQLQVMSRDELINRIKYVNIFARVVPEQKLQIIDALKTNKEIVAMTGDGVNDSPALKSAHIGVAMGSRGTDVARETADLVLLDDNFSSIVDAVRLGRRIFDNLSKAIAFIFSVHIPIAGMSLLPLIFNLPIILMPSHIAFLELIIDPACSVVFESEQEEENIMKRSPRNLNEPLFNRKILLNSVFQGGIILLVAFFILIYLNSVGANASIVRSVVFVFLVLSNLVLIAANLSRSSFAIFSKHKNKAFNTVFITAILALLIVLNMSWLRHIFHFQGIGLLHFLFTALAALLIFFLFEFVKRLNINKF